jgi:drug/metabolite transporter (DMT)-like permease
MGLNRARVALLVTVVLWASAFPAIQVAVIGYGWAGLGLFRLAIASVVLAIAAPFLKVRRPALRDVPLIVVSAVTGMAAYQLLLNWGELRVPGGIASFIIVTNPIYASVIALVFLHERLSRRQVIGGIVALAGIAAIATGQGSLRFERSALVVLAAAVAFGVYHGAIKPLLSRYTGLEVTAYATWTGMVLLLPALPSLVHALPHASTEDLLAVIFLGVAPSAIGFVAWSYAVARLPVTVATGSLYLIPPIAILVGYLWLGDTPHLIELIGGGIAIGGVAFANLRRRTTTESGKELADVESTSPVPSVAAPSVPVVPLPPVPSSTGV